MPSNRFLTINTSTGAKVLDSAISNRVDAATSGNKIPQTGSNGFLDSTFFPPGLGGEPSITAVASENLAAGDFVNIFNNSGTRTVRKADASNGRGAKGFVSAAVTSGNIATVITRGENTALTSIVIGSDYFLGVTGAPTLTPTITSGYILQRLGYGLSTGSILFEEDESYNIG